MLRLLVIAILATAANAQEFEVASIRPCAEETFEPSFVTRAGTLTANCVTAGEIIEWAHLSLQAPLARIALQGAPEWTKSELYQITAKAEDPATSERTLNGAMLLHLLETRFHLKAHPVIEEIPVYAVMLGKDDSKLRAHETPCCEGGVSFNGNKITFALQGKSLDMLSLLGPMALDRPVVNRTGITGSYSFRLVFERERPLGAAPPAEPLGPSIFDALENELGLKLVQAKGRAARIVIDSIERPTEN